MHQLRRPSCWLLTSAMLLGWHAMLGPLTARAAETGGGFTLYAPSNVEQKLFVVRVRPAPDNGARGGMLDLVRAVDLGFRGDRIAAHPTKPLLYVSGAAGKAGHNAAALPLDEAGLPQEPKPATLTRGYAYLATDRMGRFLLGCDYGSGAVDVFSLGADGLPGERVHGLAEGRPLAHCVLPSPDNRSVYIPYVKEQNALYQYAFDPATGGLSPLDPKDVGPPAGSGPRHLAYHPRLPLVYFSEEQSLGVSVYERAADGRLTLRQQSRSVPGEGPATGMSSSDIEITPDGRHLYAGIRAAEAAGNAIACYAVAADGSLSPRGLVPADKIPWGMTISPDGRFLAVTGFESATLVLYAIAADGSLSRSASLATAKHITDILAR